MKHRVLLTSVLACLMINTSDAKQISFSQHQFDPLTHAPAGTLSPTENHSGDGLKFVQFKEKVKQNWLQQIKQQGGQLIQYYPHDTYLIWASGDQMESLSQADHVRWTGHFAPEFKLSENLKGPSKMIKNVNVHFYNSGSVENVLSQLNTMGAELINHFPADPSQKVFDAVINIHAKDVAAIAQIPEVIWVGRIGAKPILDDESTSQVTAGNMDMSNVPELNYGQWLSDVGLDGTDVIWSITDTGVHYAHQDLNTRIVGGHNYPGCNEANPGDDPTTGGHGTHVAGIAGGDATAGFTDSDGYLYGLGVAPNYGIFAQNPICGSQNSWPPAGGWQELSKQAVLGGAVGSNNSWTSGEGTNHGYQATERTIDFAVRDGNFDTADVAEQFMWVFSAGNSGSGPNTLTAPKEAKNVVVTAGTQAYRFSGNVDAMYGSSSRGPSVDGRHVPTIAAPGQSIGASMRNGGSQCATAIAGTNNQYAFCTGTSMAAPHASGALVLITQWWKQNNAGTTPSPAMGKALLINSATDIDDGIPVPNFNEGWGRITLKNIFQSPTAQYYYDQEHVFENSTETWQISASVDDPNEPLRITLTWSDAPGAIGANPALVNDLDLEVITGGQTYLGNQFSNGVSVTGGTADLINNTENIIIPNPGNSVTIRVIASNIVGDGVFYSGDVTDQDFALVCNNCVQDPGYEIEFTNKDIEVCSPNDGVFDIDVVSISGYTDDVTLSAIASPAGANVSFATNPVTPGNASTMTLSNIQNVAVGTHAFDVRGVSTSGTQDYGVSLSVFEQPPETVMLMSPSDGVLNQTLSPLFEWQATDHAVSYEIEIDDDMNFASVDFSGSASGSSFQLNDSLDTNTTYYWRVKASNACGESQYSAIYSFTTFAAPGECSMGSVAINTYAYGFENGLNGWTTGSNIQDGPNTWTEVSDNVHTGNTAMFAENVGEISDQILTSPEMVLPSHLDLLTFQFWNRQEMEDSSGGGCWDGGLLKYSTDGGNNFLTLDSEKLLTDAYDGTLPAQYDNPQSGNDAWCGDPQDWLNSVIDINDLAGESVIFQFHMATDSSVNKPGWHIDDVTVSGCGEDLIFAHGFEQAPNP